jgi:hypothetical protein
VVGGSRDLSFMKECVRHGELLIHAKIEFVFQWDISPFSSAVYTVPLYRLS